MEGLVFPQPFILGFQTSICVNSMALPYSLKLPPASVMVVRNPWRVAVNAADANRTVEVQSRPVIQDAGQVTFSSCPENK